MTIFATGLRNGLRSKGGWAVLVGAAVCGVLSLAGSSAVGQDKGAINVTVQGKDTDAGLVISGQATPKEVGLPLYPGAKPSKEDGEGSAAAKLGLWGTNFGFKLAVMKMESSDSTEKVAAFYQKALAKYGKVLNCSDGSKAQSDKDKDDSSNKLTCEDNHPEAGDLLFKVGTKHKQHIVSVKPNGAGCIFHIVYLEARSDDKTPA